MKSKKMLAVLSAATMVASVAPVASVSFAATTGTVTALTAPVVTAANNQSTGTIKVVVPAGSATAGQNLVLSLDNGSMNGTFGIYNTSGSGVANAVYVDTTNLGNVAGTTYIDSATLGSSNTKVTLHFAQDVPLSQDLTFYVRLNDVDFSSASAGDVHATFDASVNSGLPTGSVKIASVASSGSATTTVSGTETSNNSFSFNLKFREALANTVTNGSTVTLKLPNGYKWDLANAALTGTQTATTTYGDSFTYSYDPAKSADNTLVLNINRTGTTHDSYFTLPSLPFVVSDPSLVKAGDITAQISTSFTSDQTSLTVGTYGDYGTTAKVASVKSITSGFDAQKLDNIELTETIPGSLIANRSVTFTLPQGVEWIGSTAPATVTDANGSTVSLSSPSVSSDGTTLKYTVNNTNATSTGADFTLKGLKVRTAADFSGDVNVQVGGSSAVTGTLKVATATAPVSVSVDKQSDIKLGLTGQPLGTVTLKEAAVGAIGGGATTVGGYVYLTLPSGVTFDSAPTVTVTDGDLAVKNVAVSGNQLSFQVKSQSISKASTIQISGAKVTTWRTLPQEDLKLTVSGSAVQDSYVAADFADDATTASVKVGQIVTPADPSVHNVAKFVIGQSTYNVNGNDVTMDVAPLIQNSRTYLPVHFVADALGVADQNTVWNGPDQTVTIFAQDKVIQLKIGSKVMTVNGAPITMDTAPMIVNGRTMLPVSFVASALGYTATWDGPTQTVTIQ